MNARRAALMLLALLAACERRSTPSATTTASASNAAPPPAPSATSSGIPTWKGDVLPHLRKTCAGDSGCHGDEPTDSVTLDLRPDRAYRELVGRPSEARRGAALVVPGDPTKSFLVDKLEGKLTHDEGKQMPLDVVTGAPKEPTPEDRAFVERVLVPWIRAGAEEK